METTEKKDKKIIIFVILGLLIITAIATVIYLSQRAKTPEHSLVIVSGGKEKIVDIDKIDTFNFSGTVVNGKGDTKEVEGKGAMIADIINTSDYSIVTVTSDDVINVGEIDVYNPVQNITEESSAISVLASAPDYVNSRIQIYLNEILVKE